MKPDGTDARQETFSAGFDGFPSVSADGSMIVYEYDDVDDPSLNGIYLRSEHGRRLARPAHRRAEARL